MKKLLATIAAVSFAFIALGTEKESEILKPKSKPLVNDTSYCIVQPFNFGGSMLYSRVACEVNPPGNYASDIAFFEQKYRSKYPNMQIWIKNSCNQCPY